MRMAPTRDVREIVREEPLMHRPILDALRGGPLTVPQIAEAIGHPSNEVVFWVMGMRRYRMVAELADADDDGYFQYAGIRVGGARMTALIGADVPAESGQPSQDPFDMRSVTLVDPCLMADIKRFGAADVSACFSCGTCTAICPLSDNDGTFPRRIIRYGQVGMKDALLSSKELWTCYHCGLCSESCPQQADPAEYMAAVRRYAIASYDRTRLAGRCTRGRSSGPSLPCWLLASSLCSCTPPTARRARGP